MSASGKRLEGRVAIVTGAARGQGEAHVRRLHAEGARVLAADVREELGRAVVDELGEGARFQTLDVSDEAAWAEALAVTRAELGEPTILVNNAGVVWKDLLLDLELEQFERMLRINLVGAWLGLKTVAPAMIAAGGGAIVNVASNTAMYGATHIGGYSATKWGLRGLTKAAALELGPAGVRVNAIHPGIIDTPMLPYSADDPSIYDEHPIKRAGSPEEVAGLVAFLVSDEGAYATGADYVLDGGMSVGKTPPSGR